MLKIYKLPMQEELCKKYKVSIDGHAVPVAAARVSRVPYNVGWPGHQRPLEQTEIAGFFSFEADGPVTLQVQVDVPFREICVRPLAKHIIPTAEGQTVTFTLPCPGQYTLEPDGYHETLHIFFNAPSAYDTPEPANTDLLYYGPGVHEIGIVELHDGQTVLLDSEAVVYGGFIAIGAQNISILGNGILDGSHEKRTNDTQLIAAVDYHLDTKQAEYNFAAQPDTLRPYLAENRVLNGCMRFYNCRNITVRGVVCRDSASFTIVPAACENVVIDNVKLIGMWRYNSDGIDLFNTTNCVIQNSFLRDFDDCVVIKGICGWGEGNNENITVKHCVIWCDWGRALEIGAETMATEYNHITFTDCDIIHGSWLLLDIQHHNNAEIHNITFRDIRCEYTRHQLPFKMQDIWEVPYEEAPAIYAQPALLGAFFYSMGLFGAPHSGQCIRNIVFRDIQVLSDDAVPMQPCVFQGLDDENCVDGVLLEHITRNGTALLTPEQACLQCNEFAKNVVLK